ncbi:MAG: MBL fold metallo-hydrolase [Sandaracinaceae bacterium]|nr:MBL fold metallo-hydrolase [Sandaracinaceae bacterium]
MQTRTDEIAGRIFRFSTFVPDVGPSGMTFNQFLIAADEPLLFHTGPRGMFPLVKEAVARVVPLDRLRYIAFGHVESDECGAMNHFLAAAPRAQVAHGALGCMVSLNDLADRPPLALADGDVLELGGMRVRHLDTPHVPHNWEAGVLFEESTRTLFCGDLLTNLGDGPALAEGDLVAPALEADAMFGATALTATTGATIRRLGQLDPLTLAVMHGSSTQLACADTLGRLADAYDNQFQRLTGR